MTTVGASACASGVPIFESHDTILLYDPAARRRSVLRSRKSVRAIAAKSARANYSVSALSTTSARLAQQPQEGLEEDGRILFLRECQRCTNDRERVQAIFRRGTIASSGPCRVRRRNCLVGLRHGPPAHLRWRTRNGKIGGKADLNVARRAEGGMELVQVLAKAPARCCLVGNRCRPRITRCKSFRTGRLPDCPCNLEI